MKIYSNVLTAADLHQAAHDVPGLDIDEIEEIRFPRLRTGGGRSAPPRPPPGAGGTPAPRAPTW